MQHGVRQECNMEECRNATWSKARMQHGVRQECNMEEGKNATWSKARMQHRRATWSEAGSVVTPHY